MAFDLKEERRRSETYHLSKVYRIVSGVRVVFTRGISTDGVSFCKGEEVEVTDVLEPCFEPENGPGLKTGILVRNSEKETGLVLVPLDVLAPVVQEEKGE